MFLQQNYNFKSSYGSWRFHATPASYRKKYEQCLLLPHLVLRKAIKQGECFVTDKSLPTSVHCLSASQSDALFVCLVPFQNTKVATCTAKMLSLRLHNKTSIINGERQDGYFYIQSVHQTGNACVVWLGNVKLYKQEKLAKSKTTLFCFPPFKICGRKKISFAAMQCHDSSQYDQMAVCEYQIVFLLRMNLKSKVKS